jgi:hypothetical protein
MMAARFYRCGRNRNLIMCRCGCITGVDVHITRKPPCCHAREAQSHIHGVRLGDHYMLLQKLTIGASYASYNTPN